MALHPIFPQKVDENVTKALDCIVNDDSQGRVVSSIIIHSWYLCRINSPIDPYSSLEQDQLFYLVYEKIRVTKGNLTPHLWTYRSRITLEHLNQTLQQQGKRDKYPILHHFLEKVSAFLIHFFGHPNDTFRVDNYTLPI